MNEKLKERIRACFWVCSLDAKLYGKSFPLHNPPFISGWCDICETHKMVTEFKRYKYFKSLPR